jgi:hypothetical protein
MGRQTFPFVNSAPASVGALFLAEDAMQKDQSWLSGLVPAGPPTFTDWGF